MGWGGSCFGKDISALLHTAREYGYESKLLQASLEVNAAQRQMVIQKLQEKLFILKGRTIGLLGLAFKPDTDDLRDAPSLHIAERLLQMGARVKAYDPVAMPACREQRPDLKIRYCESALDVARGFRRAGGGDRMAGVPRPGPGRAGASHDDALSWWMAATCFSPEEAVAAGFDYTGSGPLSTPADCPAPGSAAVSPPCLKPDRKEPPAETGALPNGYSGFRMPELPEVETVMRSIAPLVGRRIVSAEFRCRARAARRRSGPDGGVAWRAGGSPALSATASSSRCRSRAAATCSFTWA